MKFVCNPSALVLPVDLRIKAGVTVLLDGAFAKVNAAAWRAPNRLLFAAFHKAQPPVMQGSPRAPVLLQNTWLLLTWSAATPRATTCLQLAPSVVVLPRLKSSRTGSTGLLGAATPVPLSATGELATTLPPVGAVSVTVTDPLKLPGTVGEKTTLMVQFAPLARLPVQVPPFAPAARANGAVTATV